MRTSVARVTLQTSEKAGFKQNFTNILKLNENVLNISVFELS